jgi:LysM repeat protein
MVVLLVSIALAVTLALGAPGIPPITAPTSQLPATVPGLTRDEGVFLVTVADDGSRAVYFIAQNTRHSIAGGDVQLEQQMNPLWPARTASRDDVLAFAEGAPIGGAKTGLLKMDVPTEAPADTVQEETPSAVEDAPSPVASMAEPSAMPHASATTQDAPADLAAPKVAPASPQRPLDLQPASTEPTIYVVQAGDNLIRVSARYGTTVAAILDANSISNPNRVYVGNALIIPGSAPNPDVVESPTVPAPVADGPAEPVADSPASEVATTYTVKAGEWAISIARKLGVDVDQLLAANAVGDPNRVYVGQVLTIPDAGA